ncbi:MAG: leucyl aminopeptidase [Candidatus Neomarinimicrobiota bacterium]|nr:leucyl aminopeptidase [Candidatus Neomarinimicrobiota bacterium]
MSYIKNVNIVDGPLNDVESMLLCIGVYKNHSMTRNGSDIDEASGGAISSAIKVGDIKGKLGEVNYFYVNDRRLAIIGLGEKDEISSDTVRLATGSALRSAISKEADSVAIDCFCSGLDSCQAMGEGIVLGSYQFLDYKTKDKNKLEPKSVSVIGCNQNEINKGVAIGSAVCFARDLSNHPGNITTPTRLAEAAKEISDLGDMSLTVFDRGEFTQMGMGGLAGVAQGTDEPPKFIILEYNNGGNDKPKVLVGKGLTFDSGGISIKSASKMDEMKYDMCGSAVVIGVMHALAILKPKLNVVAIIPSTENLNGAKAYKPGDILTAYNGKTIEVLNTDAEGRLILADGLSYASKHYDPEYILDFATLTGAVLVSLGHIATGVMGTNDDLMKVVKKSSKSVGEKVWELPLWSEYCKQVQSNIADVKNTGAPMQAGSIAGGAFLKEFVGEKIPWVHFDIAGTAWGAKPDSINPKGSATGWGVRLVLDMMNI